MRVPALLAAAFVLLLTSAAASADPTTFPTAGLEDRVEFWKKVFTVYGQDDYILHDRIRVNLIYDVVSERSVASRTKAIDEALRLISGHLDDPSALPDEAQQIYSIIAAQGPVTLDTVAPLRGNVHSQRGVKERFRDSVVRSGRYVAAFEEMLEQQGVPRELALLPLVESGFENRARSRVGAAGIWQFTRSTGRLNMTVNSRVDQRLDPVIATKAAARLLRSNYEKLGTWPLAVTAYNHGSNGMLRASNLHGPDLPDIIDKYESRLFGYASMNFYTEFLAAVAVYQDHPQYFGQLVLDTPGSFAPTRPAVVQASTQPRPPAPSQQRRTSYRVRRGDTLWEIAQRFEVELRDLMRRNGLKGTAIQAGQILILP